VVVKQEVVTSSAAASPVTTSPVTTPPVTKSPSAPAVPVKTSTTISVEHPVFQAHRREIDFRNIKLYQELAGSLSGPWQRLADEQIKTNVLEARVEALSNKNKQLDESWKVIHRQLETSSGTKVKQLEETVQTLKEERDKLVEEQKWSNATIEELRKELEGVKKERDELQGDIKGMARLFEKHVKK
jgi:DNA repair exonuclease SbcCD ATPase subunit